MAGLFFVPIILSWRAVPPCGVTHYCADPHPLSRIKIPRRAQFACIGYQRALFMMPMKQLPTPQDLEIMAVQAGITMAQACRKANLSPAVFSRWKRGNSTPTLGSLSGLLSVLEKAVEERSNS